ncbi:hypothetical protein FU658_11695 [Alkalisalibacterium limincola]|uniref:Adenylate/guanylate cyclase domain-containing protein n=1 Tax=Alkalisalibacterium limincola TaxID=2699169 RepID=A0A5C8KJK6_9GAMM|nr:hypothetical protein FU658_11695 [Alkalisalibacterium limincola]
MSQTASTPQATTRRDPRPRLRTVLVCDLVDSTGLFRTLGDARAAGLLRSHDRLARQLMGAHAGREIDKSDGFLVLFERPAGAVRFALEYQQVVAALGQKEGVDLKARVGIHFGEVLIWRNDADATAAGATTVSVEGLAKPVAARLASLARPGQVLLSDVARNLSQRADAAAPRGRRGPAAGTAGLGRPWRLRTAGRWRSDPGARSGPQPQRTARGATGRWQVPPRAPTVLAPPPAGVGHRRAGRGLRGHAEPDAVPPARCDRLRRARLGGDRLAGEPHRRPALQRRAGNRAAHQPGAVALRQRAAGNARARRAGPDDARARLAVEPAGGQRGGAARGRPRAGVADHRRGRGGACDSAPR